MFIKKLGIDLGTANTLVYVPKKGVVINEPSVVAYDEIEKKVIAVGNQAKNMLGRTPEHIKVLEPLKDGVIADYKTTETMLNYFINKAIGPLQFFKPEVAISVPAGITSSESRAVIEAANRVGARRTYLIKEPILAAIGAGININEAVGHMVADIGGGTTEVAVISLGAIVTCASVKVGGKKIDQAIAEYIRKKYNLDIGLQTAESIKIAIGRALPQREDDEETLAIKGQDLIDGLPKIIEIRSNEIALAIQEELGEIVQTIKTVLQDTPPELSSDILDQGIILTGGGALLKNINEIVTLETGVRCRVADKPLLCVAIGTGYALTNLEFYRKALLTKKPSY